MDVCLAEATSHYVHYLDTLQYAEVSNGNFTVEALPLIKPPRQSKKSFKEFFHIVPNISTEDQEVIRAVMSEDPLCISRLPNSVRPRDALGTSCHLQLVLHQHPDGYKPRKMVVLARHQLPKAVFQCLLFLHLFLLQQICPLMSTRAMEVMVLILLLRIHHRLLHQMNRRQRQCQHLHPRFL